MARRSWIDQGAKGGVCFFLASGLQGILKYEVRYGQFIPLGRFSLPLFPGRRERRFCTKHPEYYGVHTTYSSWLVAKGKGRVPSQRKGMERDERKEQW